MGPSGPQGRAIVELAPAENPTGEARNTRCTPSGEFEFRDVPAGRFRLAAASKGRFSIRHLDVSVPSAPQVVATYTAPGIVHGQGDIEYQGGLLYLANDTLPFRILDALLIHFLIGV